MNPVGTVDAIAATERSTSDPGSMFHARHPSDRKLLAEITHLPIVAARRVEKLRCSCFDLFCNTRTGPVA